MKINVLYCFWAAMALVAIGLGIQFATVNETTLFGSAESEGQVLNTDFPALISRIRVRAGDQVRRGDTLLVLGRSELDRQSAMKQTEFKQNIAENIAGREDIEADIERLRLDHSARMSELQAQLSLAQSEEKTHNDLKNLVGSGSSSGSSLLAEKIATMKQAIQQEQNRFRDETEMLRQQRNAQSSVQSTRLDAVQQQITFLEKDRGKLVLRAPMDGYVENVYVFENEVAAQYKPLLKINPARPDKVKGFLPESASVMFRLGDTVDLKSLTRPDITAKGLLTGGSASIVEMPLRLRRFQNMGSWGREIYIKLPADNDFFISEKIIVYIRSRDKNAQHGAKPAAEKAGSLSENLK